MIMYPVMETTASTASRPQAVKMNSAPFSAADRFLLFPIIEMTLLFMPFFLSLRQPRCRLLPAVRPRRTDRYGR